MRLRRVWLRRAGWGLILGIAAACALALVSNLWITVTTSNRRHESVQDVPTRYVAIVPGAKVHRDGRPSLALEDRLDAALRLYRAGKVQRILVSGDHRSDHNDEANAMFAWLIDRGVPAEHVFTDHAGFRTLDTMQRAAHVFGVTNAVVCTHDFHLARSVFLARAASIDAVGLAADRGPDPYAGSNQVRETFARVRALLDVAIFGTGPHLVGPAIPIDGDAAQSYDARTRELARGRRVSADVPPAR